MPLHTFRGLVTVRTSNTRLKAVKKKKHTGWSLGREESATRDLSGIPWDSRLLLTLISVIWTCQAGFQGGPAPGLRGLRSSCWSVVWMRARLGAQAATQGCELTVVLPSFHSMPRPPLGGVEGTGFEEALHLWWNWPGGQGRAGLCAPARPRQRKGELSPHILAALPHSLRQVAWSRMDSGEQYGLSQARCVRLGEWESQRQPLPTLHHA